MITHILIFLYWLGYGLLHSILAATPLKTAVKAAAPAWFRYYRLGYNLLAIGLLAGLCWQLVRNPGPAWMEAGIYSQIWGAALLFSGLIVTIRAFERYDTPAFLGIGQATDAPEPLITDGLQGWVRHPLYSGTLLILLGVAFLWPWVNVLAAVLGLMAYLPFGIWWEEIKLKQLYGEAYRQYARQVKRLIPGIW
ncbi:MAG: isoprenylcysteine carboxylmethyltransferase family protein [Lewinellaceae bacterium]|nr:isoprenylcysteine carboxylmethyltransferase family protein [Lewinellaceae bacterium]